jgi:peptidoglycan/xylan/chitin deacetylase (PgdA/CDA1 family)
VLYHGGALGAAHQLAKTRYFQTTDLTLRRNRHPKFVILCYHRIGTGGIPFYSQLPTAEFDKQMRYLRDHCRLVSLDNLVEQLTASEDNSPAVAVTFDDGYLGTFTEAFSVLRKYSIPATVYLTAGCIETGQVAWYDRLFLAMQVMPAGNFELDSLARRFDLRSVDSRTRAAAEIVSYLRTVPDKGRQEICNWIEQRVKLPESELRGRMMSWDQIRTMQGDGISFQAHTMTHPVLGRLDQSALDQEIGESKRLVEQRLNDRVCHFAFPFGKPADIGENAGASLSRFGFTSAATTNWGSNGPEVERYSLRRVQIGEDTTLPMFASRLAMLCLKGNHDSANAFQRDAVVKTERSAVW